MGSPSFGLRFPFQGEPPVLPTVRESNGNDKMENQPNGVGFHEPCGIRKYPGGVFSRKAVADLLGQAMNGERKIRRLQASA